nr:DUF4166 domain-containing protein [uncultured Rhodoferax sp.]
MTSAPYSYRHAPRVLPFAEDKLWRVPVPACLLPSGDSREFEAGGRFHFDVDIAHPLP